MKKMSAKLPLALCAAIFTCAVSAQQRLPGTIDALLLPTIPTSADNLKLTMYRQCSSLLKYKTDAYKVSMAQNKITVTMGEIQNALLPLCPPSPRDEVDLGRLPAGNYTITVVTQALGTTPGSVVVDSAPFTVADARPIKVAPYVRLDYSGHWWDPNDSGWGLFIWQDAKDSTLAAWFTYMPDGKAIWYVFQPRWDTFASTFTTSLTQTSRLPGSTSPPPPTSAYTVVGTASLDFTNFGLGDDGKLTYTLAGGTQQVRNIQRFKP